MSNYEMMRERARQEAIVWQLNVNHNPDYSMEDLYDDQ